MCRHWPIGRRHVKCPSKRRTGSARHFPGEFAADVLHTYRSWAAALPEEMTASVALLRLPPLDIVPEPLRGRLTVQVRIAYPGTPEEGAPLVAPIRSIGPAIIDTVTGMPYTDTGAIHADPPVPLPVYEGAARLAELPEAAVDTILRTAGPDADCPLPYLTAREIEPDSVREAFGKDVHDRLGAIKRAYDPGNMFRVNHNIPPVP